MKFRQALRRVRGGALLVLLVCSALTVACSQAQSDETTDCPAVNGAGTNTSASSTCPQKCEQDYASTVLLACTTAGEPGKCGTDCLRGVDDVRKECEAKCPK